MKKYIALLLLVLLIAVYWIPAPRPDFFELYGKQDEPAQKLKAFRQLPVKTIRVNGKQWTYLVEGDGPVVVFAHGMGGAYDLWWQQIEALKNDYKCITYSLPEGVKTLEEASAGILQILDKEGVGPFNIVGTSMGGYIAQYLVHQVPGRITKAVFGNTFPPNGEILKDNKTKAKVVKLLPEILISRLGKRQLKKKILPAAKGAELLAAFLPSLPFSKKQFINRYRVVTDFFTPAPAEYSIKRIPKLIIESDNDPLIKASLREKLKHLYPDAAVYTFHNEGHFPYINAAGEYNQVLKSFLTKPDDLRTAEQAVFQYFKGRKEGDVGLLARIFDEDAKLFTVGAEGERVVIPVGKYLDKVKQDGPVQVKTTILDGDVQGDMAFYKTLFQYENGPDYIDYLILLRKHQEWRINSKTFQRRDGESLK